MAKLKVAIAGLRNCTSSLVQELYYYANVTVKTSILSLILIKFDDYKEKLLVEDFIQGKITI